MHSPIALFCVAFLLNAAWQIPLVHLAARLIAPMMRTFGSRAEHRVWIAAFLASIVLPACHLPFSALWTWMHLGSPNASSVSVLFGPGSAAQAIAMHSSWPVAVLLAAWCAWSLVAATRLARSLAHARFLGRSAEPLVLNETAATRWAESIAILPPKRQPRLACSRFVTGPVTIGLRRALLLLPLEFAEQVSTEDLAATFAHEMAHAARRDVLRHLVYTLLAIPLD